MAPPPVPVVQATDGQVIGGWTLRRQLGKGGMGQVWKVFKLTDAGHALVGVMKLPLANGIGDESTTRRAAVEVRVMMMMQGCANVAQILDMGVDGGVFYFVMEYVHGTDLGELVRLLRRSREKLSPETAAWIGGEVIGGLKAIHNLVIAGVPQHLRHLDIGLKNLLVSVRGDIKIADFGIASGSQDPTLTNRGTYKYMAPEHFMGVPSQKSDIFAFGAVMWELLEREHYRAGEDVAALRGEITSGKVRALRRTDVSPQLAGLVHDCLDPDETRRPTAEEALARLEHMAEYRVHRSKVCELMGRYFTGARSSGHTELMEALPADVTPDLAGLLAASKILVDRGDGLDLERVFRGMRKPVVAPGHAAATTAAATEQDDAPRPPGMFGAPDDEDDDVAAAGARPAGAAATPAQMAPASVRTEPGSDARPRADLRTTRLPEGIQQRAMGILPPTPMVHLLARGAAAQSDHGQGARPEPAPAAPGHVRADADTPWEGGSVEATGPRTAAVVSTDRFARDTSSVVPSRARQIGLLVGAGLLAIGLGSGVALLIGRTLTKGGARSGEVATAASAASARREGAGPAKPAAASAKPAEEEPERTPLAAGPVLRPVELAPAEAEPASAIEPAIEPLPDVAPAPVIVAPEPAAVEEPAVSPEPAAVQEPVPEPAAVEPSSSKPTAPPKPKAKPVEKVKVEIRNEWIKPGVEVKIGKRTATATGSAWLELPAGTYTIQWRPIGSATWHNAGRFKLKAGLSHIVLVGKVGNPSGVRHVAQEKP